MKSIRLLTEKKEDRDKIEIRDMRGNHITVIDDEFIDKWIRIVGMYAAGVYLILCRHSGVDKSCWPSVCLISDKLNISERQVRYSVKVLEKHKIIRVARQDGFHSVYHLLKKSNWRQSDTLYYKSSAPECLFKLRKRKVGEPGLRTGRKIKVGDGNG